MLALAAAGGAVGVTTGLGQIVFTTALGFQGRIAIAAHRDAVAGQLEAAGADLVLQPYRDAAAHGADRVLGRDGPRPAAGLESASPARREATG